MLKLSLIGFVERGKKSKVEAASGGFVSDTLQRKLRELEEENLSLRSEVCPQSNRNIHMLPGRAFTG